MTSGLRQLVFFVLLAGIVAAGYLYMIKPAQKHLADSKARVENKAAKLADYEKATAEAKDMTRQLEELEDAIAFFESKLPHTSQIHDVLEQVTVIAQKQGLKPKTIRTQDRKDNNGYIEQPMEMKLEGNFKAFYSFLLELEKLQRITKIRKLDLNKQSSTEGQIVADFIVSIFFQNKIS